MNYKQINDTIFDDSYLENEYEKRPSFFIVYNEVVDLNVIKNGYALLVYMLLLRYANKENNCFPSMKTLSKISSFSENTIIKAIKYLVDGGFVEKKQVKNGAIKKNFYKIKILKNINKNENSPPPVVRSSTPCGDVVATPCGEVKEDISITRTIKQDKIIIKEKINLLFFKKLKEIYKPKFGVLGDKEKAKKSLEKILKICDEKTISNYISEYINAINAQDNPNFNQNAKHLSTLLNFMSSSIKSDGTFQPVDEIVQSPSKTPIKSAEKRSKIDIAMDSAKDFYSDFVQNENKGFINA